MSLCRDDYCPDCRRLTAGDCGKHGPRIVAQPIMTATNVVATLSTPPPETAAIVRQLRSLNEINAQRQKVGGHQPVRIRSLEQLRATVSMLANYIWTKQTRPGEHMWSIPVDQERDWDCILSDAIDELEALRAAADTLAAPPQEAERATECSNISHVHDWEPYPAVGDPCRCGKMRWLAPSRPAEREQT